MRSVLRIPAFIFLFAIFLPTIGCGGGSIGTQKNSNGQQVPAITFKAQPATVTAGASTVLNWNASNAKSVSITGLGAFPATGSVKVTPTTTTTYTATATGPGGTSASSTVVSVTTSSAPMPAVTFSAQPSSIVAGASAVLSWTATNATSVSVAGVGTFGPTGTATVTPASTVTYTATATGPGGTAASNTTVTVASGQNPPPTISFSAQPNTIISGATAVLSWTTTNATSVNIPGVGSFPAAGSTKVTPSSTTTYTATAQGPGGTASAPTTVTVNPNGTSLPNLQASGGWKSWGELPPGYAICKYPCPGVTWSMNQGIKSPSLSGNAAQFNIGGSVPYADVLWSNPLIGQGSTQGLPDSGHTLLPTLHNFTYDVYFYPTNLAVTQVLEFDINMYFNGLGLIWGNQCRVAGGNEWDIWDNVGHQWVGTGVACKPVNNAWNHLTIQVQRESDNWLLFQSITLNGVTSTINKYYAPGSVPSNWWGVTVNYQMDGNDHQVSYTTFLDNFTFTYR
jgi:hypothetical protein